LVITFKPETLDGQSKALKQWYPTFFGAGAEFQISEYV